jgi:SAM-dependent methyltransferase
VDRAYTEPPALQCRGCEQPLPAPFLDLGETPLADRLVSAEAEREPVVTAPLAVAHCPACALVQLTQTVDPRRLFCEGYPYYSSVSPALSAHFRASAAQLMASRDLGPESLVLEIASNDGYLLRHFAAAGVPVLGIDPADGPAAVARAADIPTIEDFFGRELAEHLRAEGRTANVVLANNVLAHVPDVNGFVVGIERILKDDGVAVIEVPYLVDLIEKCEFDTIYHQHVFYFSVTALDGLFRRHGLHLNDVLRLPVHGGSLRLFVERAEVPTERLEEALRREEAEGVLRPEYYAGFAARVASVRDRLRALLRGLKDDGHTIAAYGAAAKGATLLSVCRLDGDILDYVVDLNQVKHGRYMPDGHLQIHPVERLAEEVPDFVLILAWNFQDEIVAQQEDYLAAGGRFIVTVPEPRIL